MNSEQFLVSKWTTHVMLELNKNGGSKVLSILFLVFFINYSMYCQEEVNDNEDPKVSTSGASYVDKLNPGQHAVFTINYRVSSNLFFETRGDLKVYGLVEVFKTSLLAKRYVSDKFYFLSGGEVELTRDFSGRGVQQFSPQLKLLNGFGYDINSHFTIEALHDLNFSENSNLGPFANPNMFSVKGKFKF
ncbi:hypothetical protein [Aquimarina sp. AU474]|uniref:hypothetical protein n=1 Tax=Aquimarina sp. AU474 TaxID=2108529 RepID=UPI000D6915C3|nr:hypothetical protein [Aquimarina sp. AU474]